MARGTMYAVTSQNPEHLFFFDTNSLENSDYDSMRINYVTEMDVNESENYLFDLRNTFSRSGFCVVDLTDDEKKAIAIVKEKLDNPNNIEDVDFGSCSFAFFTGNKEECEEHKKQFFAPYLSALKNRVSSINLDEFVHSSVAYSLTSLIDDDYDDIIYDIDDNWQTLMEFVRNLEPNSVYFFNKIAILMH